MSLGKIAFSDLVAGHDSIPMNDKFFVPFMRNGLIILDIVIIIFL